MKKVKKKRREELVFVKYFMKFENVEFNFQLFINHDKFMPH